MTYLIRIVAVLIAVVLVFGVFAEIASAQEEPPVEPGSPVIPVEDAATLFLNAIIAIIAGGLGSAPITLFLTSLVKRLPFLLDVPGATIQLVIGGILTALVWVARYLGFELPLASLMDIIVAVGPMILMFLTTLGFSSAYYAAAQAYSVPVLGFARTPNVTVQAAGVNRRLVRVEYVYEPTVTG